MKRGPGHLREILARDREIDLDPVRGPPAGLHDQLIEACAGGDTDEAVRVTAEIWHGLAALVDEPTGVPDDDETHEGPDDEELVGEGRVGERPDGERPDDGPAEH